MKPGTRMAIGMKIDTSGNFHVITDIYDIHSYEQNVDTFKEIFQRVDETGEIYDNHARRQKYDVEQEVNGLYTYDRKPKFDPEIFKKINTKKAAIEK